MKIKSIFRLSFLSLIIISCSKNDSKPVVTPLSTAIKDAVFTASEDYNVYALDINSGAKIWSFAIPDNSRPAGSFVAPNGIMYFTSADNFKLYALNANTGEKLWDFAAGDFVGMYPGLSSDNSTVYFGSDDKKVYALDAITGKQKWVSAVAQSDIIQIVKERDGLVYFTSRDKKLYAVDAATGTLKWSVAEPTGNLFSGFSIVNKVLFIAGLNTVYALDAATGIEKFKFSPVGANYIIGEPIMGEGVFYSVISNQIDGNVYMYSVNSDTGQENWKSESLISSNYGTSYLKDNILYIKSSSGKMYAVNAATGAILWSKDTAIPGYSSPVVIENSIFINGRDLSTSNNDNGVYCLDKSNGNLKWKFSTTKEGLIGISVVSGGKIYNPSFY